MAAAEETAALKLKQEEMEAAAEKLSADLEAREFQEARQGAVLAGTAVQTQEPEVHGAERPERPDCMGRRAQRSFRAPAAVRRDLDLDHARGTVRQAPERLRHGASADE